MVLQEDILQPFCDLLMLILHHARLALCILFLLLFLVLHLPDYRKIDWEMTWLCTKQNT